MYINKLLAGVVVLTLALSGCGSNSSDDELAGGTTGTSQQGGNQSGDTNGDIAGGETAPTVPVSTSRAGTYYRQEITVEATGDRQVFQVFEPAQLEVGKAYPLVLQGHGYGGSRQTEPGGFIQRLTDAGYYVISIDERGFGESGGTVRVMDPEYEGQNLIAILDWAENLEGLRRRANGEMYVGSFGGSYGGMYQVLLHAIDPKHRLRVLAPDITPHDLRYALLPNGVVKSGWGLALVGAGELPLLGLASGGDPAQLGAVIQQFIERGGPRQDPIIYETLIQAVLTNSFGEAGSNMFLYHSFKYYCDGQPAGPQPFMFATPDQLFIPPTAPPPADVLLTQGFRDTLFNFNDALHNYECLKAIGGDVRLLTHQSGHILPVSLQTAGLEDPLDPFYQALTLNGFQDGGASRSCGSMDLDDMQFAWFEEKLQDKTGLVGQAIDSGNNVCLSLAEGDAISVATVKRGGESFPIDASTPQFSSALGVGGAVLGNGARDVLLANQPLMTVPADGGVIAGLPLLDIEITGLSGQELQECPVPLLQTGCDPIFFLAIGQRPAGQERWDIIDDQLTPVRGFGPHQLEMTGIAERLTEGDELALLIFGFHAQFPVTWSRDLLVPAATISGTVQLPLLSPSEIAQDGV